MTISAVIDQVFEWMGTTHILGLKVPAGREDTGLGSIQRRMEVGQSEASVGHGEGASPFLALSWVTFGRWDNLSGPPFLISKKINQQTQPCLFLGWDHPGTLVLALNWFWLVSAARKLRSLAGLAGLLPSEFVQRLAFIWV